MRACPIHPFSGWCSPYVFPRAAASISAFTTGSELSHHRQHSIKITVKKRGLGLTDAFCVLLLANCVGWLEYRMLGWEVAVGAPGEVAGAFHVFCQRVLPPYSFSLLKYSMIDMKELDRGDMP